MCVCIYSKVAIIAAAAVVVVVVVVVVIVVDSYSILVGGSGNGSQLRK